MESSDTLLLVIKALATAFGGFMLSGWLLSLFGSGASLLSKRPHRVISFLAKSSPDTVLRQIIAFAKESGYGVDAVDEASSRAVLSDKMSWRRMSGGFFYPIILTAKGDGVTKVEVGIKSRFLQVGPIVTKEHRRCIGGIKARLRAVESD